MENKNVEGFHVIAAVDVSGSNDTQLNIVFLSAYPQPPAAKEFWDLRMYLSKEELFKDHMERILLVPFSEDLCRNEEERKAFLDMKEDLLKNGSEWGAQTIDVDPEYVE